LEAQLRSEALGAVEGQVQPGEFLAPASLQLEDVVAETYNRAVGEQADTVELTLRLAFSALAVADADALAVAQAALAGEIPPGAVLIEGTQRFARDPAIRVGDDGRLRFGVSAQGAAVPVVGRDLVRELVRGQPPDRARWLVANLVDLEGAPLVDVQPEWFPRLPWLPFRIRVQVQTAGT
jgi:hypothetical protein